MFRHIDLKDRKYSASSVVLIIAAVLCAVLPLTIIQLSLAFIAVFAYAISQEYRVGAHKPNSKIDATKEQEPRRSLAAAVHGPRSVYSARRPTPVVEMRSSPVKSASVRPRAPKERLEETLSPCIPPPPGLEEVQSSSSLSSGESPCSGTRQDFNKEVDALLSVISPTFASDRMVKELARTVARTIQPNFPEADVVGFSTGDLTSNATVGMCVPEVDLVVSINPDNLPAQLRSRLSRTGGASTDKLDARKVQKSAIRACTDRLVSAGGFKFRRSAFRGQEPKITLLAPASITGCKTSMVALDEAATVPVDLSVNTVTPQCTDAILRAVSRYDPRAKALIVFVRRWARDRGICHSAKGHLSPYAWSLLAAFYLQVAPAGEAPYLPALQGVRHGSSGFSVQPAPSKTTHGEWAPTAGVDYGRNKNMEKKSVGTLFREFVLFYQKDFNWRSEAISVRNGKRAAPDLSLPLHIVVSSAGVPTQVGPHIQDPFEPQSNLGTSMTEEGFARMQQELARAMEILTRSDPEPSLADLLEPWVVKEQEADSEMLGASRRTSLVSTSSWQADSQRSSCTQSA
jgi:hypothetical protein